MIIDIGIFAVHRGRLFEALECSFGATLLHVHARDLHQTLSELWQNLQTLFQVSLGSRDFAHQEPIDYDNEYGC